MLNEKSDEIKVKGHLGTWYVIGSCVVSGIGKAFQLESERYGDEAANLWVDESGKLILDDSWNGTLDLEEADYVII